MKKKSFYLVFLFFIILNYLSYSQNIQRGGLFITPTGNLNVLFVFAQFPDDDYDVNNAAWMKGKAPERMKNWVDEKWSEHPTENSMTDYFNVMSLNKLHFTGKCISIIAPNTRKFYLDKHLNRSAIHKDLLQELDKKMDFTDYDNWTNPGIYKHENKPDGILDMIIIIWRNIGMDLPNNGEVKNSLNMGWIGSIGTEVKVDDGKIKIADNSGATIAAFFEKDAFRFTIHEFSHFLLGGNEYHNGHGFWAMCSGYEVRSFMINAFERYKIGWIDDNQLITVKYKSTVLNNLSLPDFITTGKAYRIEIDSAKNQYFYLENHQKLSHWDYCSMENFPDDKGLFIIRQDHPYSINGRADWMKLMSAEGRFKFVVTKWAKSKWGPEKLPVFKKEEADKDSGRFASEMIPEIDPDTKIKQDHEVIYQETAPGKYEDIPARYGTGKDAFRPGFQDTFSPTTNPDSRRDDGKQTGITIKLNSIKNGICNLNIKIEKK